MPLRKTGDRKRRHRSKFSAVIKPRTLVPKGKYVGGGLRKTSVMTIPASTAVVPDKMRVKLRYNVFASLSNSAGVPFDNVFQSSLFDPDLTGSGNQPLGFDQWASFYNKYRVNGMSIKLEGANTNSTLPMMLSVYPSLSSSAPGSVAGVFSTPYAKTISVPQASGNSKTIIKNYMSTKKIFGYKSIDQEDDFTAAFGANPTNLWYFHVYGYCGTGAPSWQGIIKITFYADLFDRTQLNIS